MVNVPPLAVHLVVDQLLMETVMLEMILIVKLENIHTLHTDAVNVNQEIMHISMNLLISFVFQINVLFQRAQYAYIKVYVIQTSSATKIQKGNVTIVLKTVQLAN